MNNTAYTIDIAAARSLALNAAGIGAAEFKHARLSGGLWEMEFRTNEMHYDCYIDAVDGEIRGIDFYPVAVETYPEYAKDLWLRRRKAA